MENEDFRAYRNSKNSNFNCQFSIPKKDRVWGIRTIHYLAFLRYQSYTASRFLMRETITAQTTLFAAFAYEQLFERKEVQKCHETRHLRRAPTR
jgi:hypothetical protein